ncbi:hypothetical protein RB595_001096 [Gaeumannomyces hyphopodioides]
MSHLGPAVAKYIAAGTVLLSREDSRLPGDRWVTVQQSRRWHGFARHDRPLPESPFGPLAPHIELVSPETDAPLLSEETQNTLLGALGPASKLFKHRWVELEAYFCQDAAVIRVYLLPEDVDRRLVDRSNSVLEKLWNTLLQRLNFSPSAWQGDPSAVCTSQPPPQEGSGDDEKDAEAVSLLRLFNTIPSPNPQTEQLADSFDRDYSYSLLKSKIQGLTTTLHPHQRRSAALMFQRETQPAQTLDPRLSLVTDHRSTAWYYDPASCTALRYPRLYDSVRGGILAEEMGAGKTLICLALILATRHQPAYAPDIYKIDVPVRSRIASLADMAASAGSRESVPWGAYFDDFLKHGRHYENCLAVIERNPAYYLVPRPRPRRASRRPRPELPAIKVFLSRATLVLVPANLLQQWRDEITKHTSGLSVLVLAIRDGEIPDPAALAKYELVIFSIPRFERLHEQCVADENGAWVLESPLAQVHFKRIIVDEGHRLGSSKIGKKPNMLLVLEHIQASARWVVTGTPSTGLFGVDDSGLEAVSDGASVPSGSLSVKPGKKIVESSGQQERKDLERIGSIASLYLGARPWANSSTENGDSRAEWSVYMMQKKHNGRGRGCHSVLKSTLESLIIRHRKSEIGDLLPDVVEKVVYLDGSYQDKLALNLFSMMVISNAVQSQRTDRDFFFHPRQRKSLLQLLANVKQATFFGGAFFDKSEIITTIVTAEEFLAAKKIPVSEEDERLLRDAVAFGRLASANKLKHAAKTHSEVPVYVENFPGAEFEQASQSWSIMGEIEDHDQRRQLVCTDAPILLALQRFVRPWMGSPESLDIVFRSGTFAQRGEMEKAKIQEIATPTATNNATLAGNTKLGDSGTPKKSRSKPSPDAAPDCASGASEEVAESLASTRLVSTASAKLSYLLDAIVENQQSEKILVFYENENIAYWLAGYLEILQVRHLIYAKSLSAQRRAQYVATFNESPNFRVMLMDLTQAAFGLDMRSASRIYFINPVLNPQVEAQAIGRVRRISQNKAVTVETLVLRGTLEEAVVERRKNMTQAEHQKCKSLLDDKPLLEWFRNAKIMPLPDGDGLDGPAQMTPLKTPLPLFGHGAGRLSHPDEDLVVRNSGGARGELATAAAKRPLSAVLESGGEAAAEEKVAKRPREAKGVRFVDPAGDE